MKTFPIAGPSAALAVLAISTISSIGGWLIIAPMIAICVAVFADVHHAELIAHRFGEPFGSLVLALAVTIIEVALIVSMMLTGGEGTEFLARDTIYAAVMIICSGVVGCCLLVGGLYHRQQVFHVDGMGPGLAALVALASLSLVLPRFTTSSGPGTYTAAQLSFVAVVSLSLWATFVFVQTVRHRDYFLPASDAANEEAHAVPPTNREAWLSFGLLLISLVSVIVLAKVLSPAIESGLDSMGAPRAVIGVVIAMLVLLPETVAALRSALANRIQTSLNLAIGSALATIGLTIPAVVAAGFILDLPLVLGLDAKDITLMSLTFLISSITLGSGRTHTMHGAIHVVLFAAFLFLSLVP